MGTWESSEIPKRSEFDFRGQNTSPRGVLYTVGKVLKRRCRKWPRMGHSDICSTGACRRSATHRWKALKESYKFALDFTPIRGLSEELWAAKVSGVQTETISRQFRNSHLGVPGQTAIWMWPPWSGAKYTIWGKVVASPESGPWWVKWIQSCLWLVPAPRVLQNVN
jgi:hypothetical protein